MSTTSYEHARYECTCAYVRVDACWLEEGVRMRPSGRFVKVALEKELLVHNSLRFPSVVTFPRTCRWATVRPTRLKRASAVECDVTFGVVSADSACETFGSS
eukprot:3295325-Pleurochrysis_carterae.AAC.1